MSEPQADASCQMPVARSVVRDSVVCARWDHGTATATVTRLRSVVSGVV